MCLRLHQSLKYHGTTERLHVRPPASHALDHAYEYHAQLYEERYNLLNAYLAPGNFPLNLRYMHITNANHPDYSFPFTLHGGDPVNSHLKKEYMAILETNHRTALF
jgi:hypothetical protein